MPSSVADLMHKITVIHFVIIGLFALFMVFVIVWGMGLRAKRRAAEQELRERGELVDVAAEKPAARPIAPPPPVTAPSPPPLSDSEVPASMPVHDEMPAPDRLADEPIAAAAPLEASPATEAVTEPVVAAEPVPVEPEAPAEPQPEPAPETAPVTAEPETPAAPEPAPEPTPVEERHPTPAEAVEPTAPVPVADAVPASEPAAGPDDLTRMKGVGPRLADQLNSVGITSFAQIAALTPAEAVALDAKLGNFQGRLERDRWIEQAGYLAKDDVAGFEAVFGKL